MLHRIIKYVIILNIFNTPYLNKTCYVSQDADQTGNLPSTIYIQTALNECSNGGLVSFRTAGTYLLGSVTMTGNDIHFDIASSTLLQSPHRRDYGPNQQRDWYMIRIANCTNCSITGPTILNGQSDLWVEGHYKHRERKKVKNWTDPTCVQPEECRPRLLGILDSNAVNVSNVSLLNPIYWGLHIINSHNIQVGPDFTLQGDREVPNNDGIDIDSSSNVTVTGCTIDTADDAICIKTKLINTTCHHILIYNCTLQSKSSALKIGSESVSDIFNITFDNITITRATRAMAIQQRDSRPGASVHNITFSNVIIHKVRYPPDTSWWGAGELIHLSLLPRSPDPSTGMVEMPGSMHDVYFRNITAYSADTGVVVVGNLEDKKQVYGTTRIKNIHIEGLMVVMRRWREKKEEEEEDEGGGGGDDIASIITTNKRREAYLDLRPSTVGMVPLDADMSHVALYLGYCQGVKIEGLVVDSDGVYAMDGTTEGIDLDGLVMGRIEEGREVVEEDGGAVQLQREGWDGVERRHGT